MRGSESNSAWSTWHDEHGTTCSPKSPPQVDYYLGLATSFPSVEAFNQPSDIDVLRVHYLPTQFRANNGIRTSLTSAAPNSVNGLPSDDPVMGTSFPGIARCSNCASPTGPPCTAWWLEGDCGRAMWIHATVGCGACSHHRTQNVSLHIVASS
jgi:hypothetical protein